MRRRFSIKVLLALLLVSMFAISSEAYPVNASGTIYIRADGSIDPPTANITSADNVTYYFSDNNYDMIVIERDNILLDGQGYLLQGTSGGTGIVLSGRSNVTVRNIEINAFYIGVRLDSSSNNTVSGNNITANNYGIILRTFSSNNTICGNTIVNSFYGVYLAYSSNNNVSGNIFADNGLFVYASFRNVVVDNLVNGKPLVYLENASDLVVEDAGQVILINCIRITVENLNLSHTTVGAELWRTNSTTITGNAITSNNYYGVYITFSSNNTVSSNNIINENNGNGLVLSYSSNNTVSGNNITSNNYYGVWLNSSSNNTVSGNNIIKNYGVSPVILSHYSSYNTISENYITGNSYAGISLNYSSNYNSIYHNNFINSQWVILVDSTDNVWDNGYPSGGNFWDGYNGADFYSGPYQNLTGSDGIGDTPHVLDSHNQDNYPWMNYEGKLNSTITIAAHPTTIICREHSTINGTITPTRSDTNVTLWYRLSGEQTWHLFNVATTNENSVFSLNWTPPESGTYELKTSWIGDNDTHPAESSIITVVCLEIPTLISVQTSCSSQTIGYAVTISGCLTDKDGNALREKTVVLYYTFSGINQWIPITSDDTDALGNYEAMWIPTATGYFVLKAEWQGNTTHTEANSTVTLSSYPYNATYIFTVESNSNVSALDFNTTDWSLNFRTTGLNSTRGYASVTVAEEFVDYITNTAVYVDGNATTFSVAHVGNSWILTFNYTHSTHDIEVDLLVTIPGDMDGDFDVDIFDIVLIAGAYGSSEGDPEYIAICDIDGDGDVDIFDVVIAAGNYGESW